MICTFPSSLAINLEFQHLKENLGCLDLSEALLEMMRERNIDAIEMWLERTIVG